MMLSAPSWLVISKFAGLLIMPLGLLWLGLIVLSLATRGALRGGAVIALALLTLGGNPWLGAWLIATLEQPYSHIDPFAEEAFEAIVVLGGGTGQPTGGRPQLGAAGDRVLLGAQMYYHEQTPLLITCGTSAGTIMANHDLSADTKAIWQRLAIPEDAISVLRDPNNTRREIEVISKLVEERQLQRVGLITSAWHLRRALALASHHELTLHPLPADRRGIIPPFSPTNIVPQAAGLDLLQTALWEYLGTLVGR